MILRFGRNSGGLHKLADHANWKCNVWTRSVSGVGKGYMLLISVLHFKKMMGEKW